MLVRSSLTQEKGGKNKHITKIGPTYGAIGNQQGFCVVKLRHRFKSLAVFIIMTLSWWDFGIVLETYNLERRS